ncbi:[Fe-Fe] hydrogenase large subunit C-terminal domain-containing protein [Lutispora thermophila]|uniref:Iron only hydrogenase large subunit, C-terminal domain n=1 Tax=Lutispora thermophila DSM 19022 TaxID=1122184 RepID=A0A1M6FRE8_9FIRM|nr:[Fe-Fe] hydrogenase large subunit C-terminal domain-containing protein [Lutispora thermophila]SHJ00230.1 Iron only hydrogenase large subunit, C-terminal domain [Lutispora thermophila DSM 19022]
MNNEYNHSVILREDRCIGCTSCLKVCPTEAIRVRDGKAKIISDRCIDCGECIKICPNHAKSAITDDLNMLKRFKYNIAIPSLTIYGQFPSNISIDHILTSIKRIGFDEVIEGTLGADISIDLIKEYLLKKPGIRFPLINSSCPAILRLIQIRFPDLIPNIIDIETPIEITARIAKTEVSQKTGLNIKDIGVFFITPCTARVTSIRNPIGIKESYIDGAISIKDIYGEIVRNLGENENLCISNSTRESLLWSITGGQAASLGIENYLDVDGIHDVIKVLEEVELGKLEDVEFIECSACTEGCVGGPLVIQNSFVAKNRIMRYARKIGDRKRAREDLDKYIKMYEDGFIRLTEEIEPKSVMILDKDLTKSIQKMELVTEILKNLPGLDCGICGSPTCRAFAEDIVKGENKKAVCMIKTIYGFKRKNV